MEAGAEVKTNITLNFLASGLGLLLLPVQLITTFLTGLLAVLTLGLFMVVLDIIWNVLFLWPMLGTSFLWLQVPWLRWPLALVGVMHALLAGAYCALVTCGGDFEARRLKLRIAYTWPYSYDYLRLIVGKPVVSARHQDVERALSHAAI